MTNKYLTFEYLSKKPSNLHSLTGLFPEQISALAKEFYQEWERIKMSRRKISNRERKIGGGRKLVVPRLEDRIIIFSFYAKHYCSYSLIEMFFQIDNATVCRIVNEISLVLGKRMMIDKDRRKIITPDELFYAFPDLRKIILDATEQRVNKRDDNFYSGKSGQRTLKTQIITNSKGKILFADNYSKGRVHDSQYLRKSKIGDWLRKGPPVMVLADSGYQGMNKNFNVPFFTPEKRSQRKKNLSLEEKTWNKKLSRERIKVEHAFGKLKQFKILAHSYRNSLKIYSPIFRSVANIVNLRMATN